MTAMVIGSRSPLILPSDSIHVAAVASTAGPITRAIMRTLLDRASSGRIIRSSSNPPIAPAIIVSIAIPGRPSQIANSTTGIPTLALAIRIRN